MILVTHFKIKETTKILKGIAIFDSRYNNNNNNKNNNSSNNNMARELNQHFAGKYDISVYKAQ